jgi:hypothetical protein
MVYGEIHYCWKEEVIKLVCEKLVIVFNLAD